MEESHIIAIAAAIAGPAGLGAWFIARYNYHYQEKKLRLEQIKDANIWIKELYKKQDELDALLLQAQVQMAVCKEEKKALEYQLEILRLEIDTLRSQAGHNAKRQEQHHTADPVS